MGLVSDYINRKTIWQVIRAWRLPRNKPIKPRKYNFTINDIDLSKREIYITREQIRELMQQADCPIHWNIIGQHQCDYGSIGVIGNTFVYVKE